MSKAPASDSRPMLTSWVRISEPFASHLQNLEEEEVHDTSQLSTFPTDQVPQPVTRDTIATTAKAASTDSRGSACLPQSAPTVQAQVSSTVAGCVSCDDCTQVNLRHNQAETQCTAAACDSRDRRGAQAGLPVGPVTPARMGGDSSVIASLSCPIRPSCPDPTPIDAGNSNVKSNNKMQSVNVTFSTNNLNKGNDNCLLNECNTAVTVPNTETTTTKQPQQLQQRNDEACMERQSGSLGNTHNNCSHKSVVEVVAALVDNAVSDDSQKGEHEHEFDGDSRCRSANDKSEKEHTRKASEGDMSYDRLVRLCARTRALCAAGVVPRGLLGLYGGGESSLSTGTAGWGTPPGTNANNNNGTNSSGWGSTSNPNNANNQQQWNNNQNRNNSNNPGPQNTQDTGSNKSGNGQNANMQQQQQQQPQTSQAGGGGGGGGNQGWGQQNGKGSQQNSSQSGPGTGSGSQNSQSGSQQGGGGSGGSSQQQSGNNANNTNSTKQQLEQLNNMREALFAQDGWGGQHVNQDTNWDIPSSPEPSVKMDGSGPQQWKPAVNNGTDLWEVNLRNGGQPPPQPQQKTPWGHTPSTNIGGTWGEDDDVADSSNVWTGVPSGAAAAAQQWGGAATGAGAAGAASANGGMWGAAPKKETEWGGAATAGGGGGWGDPRGADPRAAAAAAAAAAAGLDPRDMRLDPRDMRPGGSDPMRMLDPREQLRLVSSDMRGDPRGITGRLNGSAADSMWGQPPQGPHHLHHQPGKLVGPATNSAGVNQWPGPPPKDMGMGGKPTGWEELSPPSQRRMPNYDDGTSLWGNPANQGRVAASGGNLSHWKELPTGPSGGMGRGGSAMGCPPGMAQSRLKPDVSVWGSRNGSWGDDPGAHSGWDDGGRWPDGGASSWAAAKDKSAAAAAAAAGLGVGAPLWDTDMDWGGAATHKPPGPKQGLSKDFIWNSKQFRVLVEMGYKKEEAENALRARDMSLGDALDLLSLQRTNELRDGWRARHDEHFDHPNSGPFPQRFGPAGPSAQMPFPPSGNPSLLNSINSNAVSNNPPLASINNMSPAIVHKMLNQGGASQAFGSGGGGGGGGRSLQPQSQPSTQQLRMLVQQIQMAVQAGYLNHQILNQPLAPQTLLLLNQLLQQIKQLQQLMAQQTMAQSQGSLDKRSSTVVLQCSVLITKTKQQIHNLQNQIAAQQAIYVKQQQQQQHVGSVGAGGVGGPADFFKSNIHDSINALQTNFTDLGITKDSQVSSYQNQQSRLNQWKLPALEKESEPGGEFSRAPGSVTKPLVPSHSSPNLGNPLGLNQPDGLWSNGRSSDTGGWPDAAPVGDSRGASDVGKESQWPTSGALPSQQPSLTDLVPEFEPGKPWKGNQIKSIEEDPSITPGSVVRSPLSLATIKDTEIFTSSAAPSKSSPPGGVSADTIQPLSLSSSTWSFNPPTTTPSAFTSPLSKVASLKGAWGETAPPPTAVTSELWGAPMGKSRGPPPGLAKGGASIGLAANGWSTAGRAVASGWGSQTAGTGWGSPWLLLRNLTAQIDGSTLRTLCMQHGPLQSYHLYLHQGFALVKYSSREEATKAQQALNNCVLGNTTILAESPAESDANTLLQQLAPQQGGSSGAWRSSGKQATAADTWNTGWPNNPSSAASLWGAPPMDSGDPARATPSSLNSFLPGDLLGGESM